MIANPSYQNNLRDCGIYETINLGISDNPNLVYTSNKFLSEKSVQIKLKEMLGGVIEKRITVSNIDFRIDLLTDNQIIEIKRYSKDKMFNAIGQLLTYATFYPNHEKIIHLLGIIPKNELTLFVEVLKIYNITLKWEFIGVGGYVI